jgi:sporulation protein YlmC with PRC-barrel domain
MKARLCLVASLAFFAGQAVAEEAASPPAASTPATTEQAAPPAEPLDKAGTEPTKQAAPAASESPAPDPIDRAATEPLPQSAPAQKAEVPATVVVSELTEVDDSKKLVKPWALPADTVEEMDVFDANGKKIGEVDAVLQDKNGEIKGVAVAYGGFLGFGEKGVIVTLDQLKLKDGNLVTELTEDTLADQPAWNN